MIRRPPRSTRTDTRFPYTTLFRSIPALTIAACGFGADAQEGEPNEADNRTAQRTFDVGVFDSVSLGGHHNVVVKVGPAASVRAEGPASEVERLKIEVKDGDLHKIGRASCRERVCQYV